MSLNSRDNSRILDTTIDFIFSTKGFNEQLMKVVSTDHNQATNL